MERVADTLQPLYVKNINKQPPATKVNIMRTAISDEEMSDGSAEQTASAAKSKRQRTSAVKYNDLDDDYVKNEDEDVVKTVENNGTNGDNGDDDEEDEEDDDEEDGDVYGPSTVPSSWRILTDCMADSSLRKSWHIWSTGCVGKAT